MRSDPFPGAQMNVAIESDEMNAGEDHESRAEVHEEDDYGVHDFHGEVRGEVHEVGREVGREAVHEEQKEVRKSGKMSDVDRRRQCVDFCNNCCSNPCNIYQFRGEMSSRKVAGEGPVDPLKALHAHHL